MVKSLLITLFLCFSFISFSQTEKQMEMREKYQPAPERVYLKKSTHEQNRNNRAVIFYDDFSTPGIWTMTNTASPSNDWQIVDSINFSFYDFIDSIMNSTSGNEFALLNSYYQSVPQNASITTTNSINCSSHTNVQLRFENYFFRTNEILSVQISNDGINYDTYLVNSSFSYLPSNNIEEVTIDISATAANQPTVWIRFNYVGNGYFWAIDDIYVEDIPNYNLKFLKPNIWNQTYEPIMMARVDYSIVPVSQIDNLIIGGTLSNYGLNSTDSTAIKYTVSNSISTVIDLGYSDFKTMNSFTTLLDSAIWGNTTSIGNYTINYTAIHDSITQNYSNINNYTESYKVVPNSGPGSQYARDNDIPTGNGLWNGFGNGYIMGNSFTVYNNITAYSIDVSFTPDSDPGVVACIILYEIDPATGDFTPIYDGCLDGVEYTLQAGNLSSTTTMNWQRFCLNPYSPTHGIPLTQGTTYIAAISHYGGTEQMIIQDGGEAVHPFTSWIFDQVDASWYYLDNKAKIRIGLDNVYYCYWGINENTSQYLSLSQNYPNPSDNETKIDYLLEKSTDVYFELVDITGKIIYSEDLGNKGAGAYSLTLNTENYADGIYFYSMTAGDDKITKKLTIAR